MRWRMPWGWKIRAVENWTNAPTPTMTTATPSPIAVPEPDPRKLILPPQELRERLADALRSVKVLKGLLKLSESIARRDGRPIAQQETCGEVPHDKPPKQADLSIGWYDALAAAKRVEVIGDLFGRMLDEEVRGEEVPEPLTQAPQMEQCVAN